MLGWDSSSISPCSPASLVLPHTLSGQEGAASCLEGELTSGAQGGQCIADIAGMPAPGSPLHGRALLWAGQPHLSQRGAQAQSWSLLGVRGDRNFKRGLVLQAMPTDAIPICPLLVMPWPSSWSWPEAGECGEFLGFSQLRMRRGGEVVS